MRPAPFPALRFPESIIAMFYLMGSLLTLFSLHAGESMADDPNNANQIIVSSPFGKKVKFEKNEFPLHEFVKTLEKELNTRVVIFQCPSDQTPESDLWPTIKLTQADGLFSDICKGISESGNRNIAFQKSDNIMLMLISSPPQSANIERIANANVEIALRGNFDGNIIRYFFNVENRLQSFGDRFIYLSADFGGKSEPKEINIAYGQPFPGALGELARVYLRSFMVIFSKTRDGGSSISLLEY